MSLDNLKFPGNMSSVLLSLLLLGTVLQGLEVNILHYKTMEAIVGENVSLPCIFNDTGQITITQIEWRKNHKKLVVHHKVIGSHFFWPELELGFKPETDVHNKLLGSYLQLQHPRVNDSGTYFCELTAYPQGGIGITTHLNVKDAEVTCDQNSTLEVAVGENVTVQCELRLPPRAQYRWLKNNTLVSETRLLEIRWMDESQAGIYTLTVSAGSRSLQRSFNITTHSRTSTHSTPQNTDHPSPTPTRGNVPPAVTVESSFTATETGQHEPSSAPLLTSTAAQNPGSHSSGPASTENPYATESQNHSSTVRPISGSSTMTSSLETHHKATDEHHQSSVTMIAMVSTMTGGVTTRSGMLSSSHLMTSDVNKKTVTTETGWGMAVAIGVVCSLVTLAGSLLLGIVLYWRRTITLRMARPPPFKPPPPPGNYCPIQPQLVSTSCSAC